MEARTSRVLFSMCAALVLVVASVTALNLALPEISVGLSASNSALTWVADGYTVALAGLVLPLGALGDRIGRRHVLVAGALLFGFSALAAACVDTVVQLIACRVVMGAAAAMVMPSTLSTITAIFPTERRSSAVATWASFASAGAILGMVAAGALLEAWSWRSIFVVSAIVAFLSALIALVMAPNTRDESHAPLDYVGAILSAIGIGSLVFAIIQGGDEGYLSRYAVAAFAVSAITIAGFVAWASRRATPLLDPRLFLLTGFRTGTVGIAAQFLVLFGFYFVGLQFLQLILDYSPFVSALGLVPVAIVVVVLSRFTPALVERWSARLVMTSGLLALAVSLVLLAQLGTGASYLQFLGCALIASIGLSWAGPPGTHAVIASLPKDKQGVASAVNDASREVGAALGIAIMGSLYTSRYTSEIIHHMPALPEQAAATVQESAAGGLALSKQLEAGGPDLAAAVRSAFIEGLSHSLTAVAIFTALIAVGILATSRRADFTASNDLDAESEPSSPESEAGARTTSNRDETSIAHRRFGYIPEHEQERLKR